MDRVQFYIPDSLGCFDGATDSPSLLRRVRCLEKDPDMALADDGSSEDTIAKHPFGDLSSPIFSDYYRGDLPTLSTRERLLSTFNMLNALLGAGTVSMPYAAAQSGLIPFVVLLIIFATLSVVSIDLIAAGMDASRLGSLESISHSIGGPFLALLSQTMMILFCFGTAVGYMSALRDIIETYLQNLVPEMAITFTFISVALVVLQPLAFKSTLRSLALGSALSFFAVAMLSSVIVFTFLVEGLSPSLRLGTDGGLNWNVILFGREWCGYLKCVCLLMFSYNCQANITQLYGELTVRRRKELYDISKGAMVLSTSVYMASGCCGYLWLGVGAPGNVIVPLGDGTGMAGLIILHKVVQAIFGLGVIFAYPMNLLPIGIAFGEMVLLVRQRRNYNEAKIEQTPLRSSMLITTLTPGRMANTKSRLCRSADHLARSASIIRRNFSSLNSSSALYEGSCDWAGLELEGILKARDGSRRVRVVTMWLTVILALTYRDVAKIFSLVGAGSGSYISMLLPAVIALHFTWKGFLTPRDCTSAIILLIVGSMVAAVGLFDQFWGLNVKAF